jgi:Leucine-rich repeat (LRR) protein
MKNFILHSLLTVGLLLTLHFTTSSSFCPQYCGCNDTSLSVQCHSSSNLRVVPIFLNPHIKSLSLSHNQIKDITLSLQFYQELQHLDISSNELSSLGKGNFESLRALLSLNVSYNQVKSLESGSFQGLGSLLRLDLSGNQVEKVEPEVFWSLRNVLEIILDRNRLEFLDWDLFRGLDKLVRISAQYNFIQVNILFFNKSEIEEIK